MESESYPSITVTISAPLWHKTVTAIETTARSAAQVVFDRLHRRYSRGASLDIHLVDDRAARQLNARWRGVDRPTNVLAFAGEGDLPPEVARPTHLGDVVLALETCVREASEQDKQLGDHLQHLVVHGVLHLLGFDHGEPAAAAEMEALETELLDDLGIPNPYLAELAA